MISPIVRGKLFIALFVCFLTALCEAQDDAYIGEVRMFAGNFAPRGWVICDGRELSISENSALFSIIGTTYGGDGRTTFRVPDLRDKVAVGAGVGPGLPNFQIGQKGGVDDRGIVSVKEWKPSASNPAPNPDPRPEPNPSPGQVAATVWDKNRAGQITLADGDLEAKARVVAGQSQNRWENILGTNGRNSGKHYFEVTGIAGSRDAFIGIAKANVPLHTQIIGDTEGGWSFYTRRAKRGNGTNTPNWGADWQGQSTAGVAVDLDAGKIWFSVNGAWQRGGNPANGANPAFEGIEGTVYPAASFFTARDGFVANFGASSFRFPVPEGFEAGWKGQAADTDPGPDPDPDPGNGGGNNMPAGAVVKVDSNGSNEQAAIGVHYIMSVVGLFPQYD